MRICWGDAHAAIPPRMVVLAT
ncbi:MAG: hypothetical protein RJB28_916, partial [Actinomycetota bacterium]